MNNNTTLNTNSNLSAESAEARLAHVSYEEQPYEGAGFPGCGDGSDDFADYNANEADDYRDEGYEDSGAEAEDAYLDSYYESQYECPDY